MSLRRLATQNRIVLTLLLLALYLLLTLILTWPTITHLTTHLPGDGGDDPEHLGERAGPGQRRDAVRDPGDAAARHAQPGEGHGDQRHGAVPGPGSGRHYPDVAPREAYARFLADLLERTNANALPDASPLKQGQYPRFNSEAELSQHDYGVSAAAA